MRSVFLRLMVALLAAPAATFGTERHPQLDFDPAFSLTISGAAALGVGAFNLFEKNLVPAHCRWCAANSVDRTVRDHVKWSNASLAHNMSHAMAYGVVPAFALGSHAWIDWRDGRFSDFYADGVTIAEATLIAALVGQVIHVTVARQRPEAHFSSSSKNKASENTSFYSNHTTIAFALATSSGTVATMRQRSEAPFIWVGGLTLASLSAYFRLAADKHYATDVLAGAAAGALIGFALPYFFHSPKGDSETTTKSRLNFLVAPSEDGMVAAVKWRW